MKSKFLTFFLSFLPGVGHLYLGLLTRGLHFMLLFFGSIFIIILVNIEALIVLLPIIWFYSLFDALQRYELLSEGIVDDAPLFILDKLVPYQKGLAYLLIGMGAYILFERFLRFFSRHFNLWWGLEEFRVAVVARILIFIGFRLLRSVRYSAPSAQPIALLEKGESQGEKGDSEHDQNV